MGIIIKKLEDNIFLNSGFQLRDYLGLSKVTLSACRRKLWYEASPDHQGIPETPGLFKCREGYFLEKDLTRQLKEANFPIIQENKEFLPFPSCKKIRFHIDGLIRHPEKDWILLEIKHRNARNFEKFKERTPGHIEQQIQAYLHFLRPPVTPNHIDEAILLVKNIDTAEHIERYINYRPEIGKLIEAKLLEIKKLLDVNTPPARDYSKNSTHCQYCPYSKTCWGF